MKVKLDIKVAEDSYNPGTICTFNGQRDLVEGKDTAYPNEVNPNTVSIYYNMHFKLKWEEVPWS
jgi:hypothetical protein